MNDDIWDRLHDRWFASAPTGLATVVSTFGSAPRRAGAIMFCCADGTVTGSVSGGCVEGAVHGLAEQVIADGEPVRERYGVSDEQAGAVGLTCGGTLEVFVERVDRQTFPELGVLVGHARAGTPVAVATVIAGGAGHLVCTAAETVGGTDDAALDAEIAAAARDRLARGDSGVVPFGRVQVFVNCLAPPPRMLVYGSTDFAAAMVRQGRLLGRRVTLCDARPVFTTRERFPEADEVVVDWPHRHLTAEAAAGRLDPRTVLVSLTHDPKFEVPLLRAALKLDLAYVGAMASRPSAERCRTALREAGATPAQLGRLSSPVGLHLGGDTPAEAAVSIAAEIVLVTRGGVAGRLTDTTGPIHRPSPKQTVRLAKAGRGHG
ncbi:XdhC/CoxI family protein [Actinomycetes bacterium KLBMP 9797]